MVRKHGFTLIELLVVIAIIALLLAILMPGLGKAKRLAQDVICRSNLKQWGAIWLIYANKNDGKLPPMGVSMHRGDWVVPLRDEYPTGKITKCPVATKITVGVGGIARGGVNSAYINIPGEEECSYGLNCWVYSVKSNSIYWGSHTNFWKTFEGSGGGSRANNIPLFMDSVYRGGFPKYSGWDFITMVDSEREDNGFEHVWDGMRQFAMPRHGTTSKAGTNVLFFDLSARHVNVKEMWTLKWHKSFDTKEYLDKRNSIWPGEWMDRFAEP